MNWSLLGQQATVAILVASLGWLIVEGARWMNAEREEQKARAQEIKDLEFLLGIAQYLEKREREAMAREYDDAIPFALDGYDQAS